MVDKLEKGRWPKYFNERAKPPAEKLSDKGGHSGQGGRPPTHGLQGGPPPPGSVRRDVDRQVREQKAKEGVYARMRQQEMANRKKQSDLSKKWDEQNKTGNRGKVSDGKGSNGSGRDDSPGDDRGR